MPTISSRRSVAASLASCGRGARRRRARGPSPPRRCRRRTSRCRARRTAGTRPCSSSRCRAGRGRRSPPSAAAHARARRCGRRPNTPSCAGSTDGSARYGPPVTRSTSTAETTNDAALTRNAAGAPNDRPRAHRRTTPPMTSPAPIAAERVGRRPGALLLRHEHHELRVRRRPERRLRQRGHGRECDERDRRVREREADERGRRGEIRDDHHRPPVGPVAAARRPTAPPRRAPRTSRTSAAASHTPEPSVRS